MWKANRGMWVFWVGLLFLTNSLTVRAGGSTRSGHSGSEDTSEAPHVQVAKALIEGARLDVSLKTDVEMNLRSKMSPKDFEDSLDKVPGMPKDAKTLLSDSFKKLFDADETNAVKAFKKALNEVPLVNVRQRETAGGDKGPNGEQGPNGEKGPNGEAKKEEDKAKDPFTKLFEKLKELQEKKEKSDPSAIAKGDKDKDKEKKDAGSGTGGGGEGKGDGGGAPPGGGDQGQKNGGAPRGAHNDKNNQRNQPPPPPQQQQETSKREEKKPEEPRPAPARSKEKEEEEPPKEPKKAEAPPTPPAESTPGDSMLSMAEPPARSSLSAIANSGQNPFEAALGSLGGFDGGALSGLSGSMVSGVGGGAGTEGGGGVESMNMNGDYMGEMGSGYGETPFRVIEGGYGEGSGSVTEGSSSGGGISEEASDILESVEALLKGKSDKIIVEERASPDGRGRGVAYQKRVGPGILKVTGSLVDLTCVKSNEPADEGFDPKAVGLCDSLQKKASLRH